jgi:hypothetical protein
VIHEVSFGRLALEGVILDQKNRRLLHDSSPEIENECVVMGDKIASFCNNL